MYCQYFKDGEVRGEYSKEFVSLWGGWLGSENYHKLDEVEPQDWEKFNTFVSKVYSLYEMYTVTEEGEVLEKVNDISDVLSNYEESMNKECSQFTKLVLPSVPCVITEEWDYTYIIWYKDREKIAGILRCAKEVGLEHFQE